MNTSRSTINQMDKLFESLLKTSKASKLNYPRYSLWTSYVQQEKVYTLDVLVPGLSRDELSVRNIDGVLYIKATPADDGHRIYLEKGFSTKGFKMEFPIANSWKVKPVSLAKGILSIEFKKEIEYKQVFEIG